MSVNFALGRTALRALSVVSLACGSVLLSSLAAPADDSHYLLQVADRLMSVADRMGYAPAGDPYISLLGQQTYDTATYDLDAGTRYLIMAACDEDCEDLDLQIFDADGNSVGHDDAVDSTPMVYFTPEVSGPYSVDVVMYSCSVEACYQAVDVFVEP